MKKISISLAVLLGCSTAALAVDPPGQEKKAYDVQSAKEYAPGQIKGENGSAGDVAPGRTKGAEADVKTRAGKSDTKKIDQPDRSDD